MRNLLIGSMALSALLACGGPGGGGFLFGTGLDGGSASAGGDDGGASSGSSGGSGAGSSGSGSGAGSSGSSSGGGSSSSGAGSSGGDAGSSGGGTGTPSADGGAPPVGTSVCTSGTTWTGGNNGSSKMTPGRACNACHATSGGEAPMFGVAGTVYPTANEPNDCNGLANVTVVITDANGQQISVTTNSAGNFSSQAVIATPYKAKVVSGTKELAMISAQTSGDCNSCHTETGANGAPGRIMSP